MADCATRKKYEKITLQDLFKEISEVKGFDKKHRDDIIIAAVASGFDKSPCAIDNAIKIYSERGDYLNAARLSLKSGYTLLADNFFSIAYGI